MGWGDVNQGEKSMPILQGVEDSVTNSNFKYAGELGMRLTHLVESEAGAHWAATNKIREAYLMRGTRDFAQEDISEAISANYYKTGDAVGEKGIVAALVAAVAQMLSKQGNNAPPQTGTQDVK